MRFVTINLCLGAFAQQLLAAPSGGSPNEKAHKLLLMGTIIRFNVTISNSHNDAKMFGHGKDVFIAPPTHVHHDDMVCGQARRNFHHMG